MRILIDALSQVGAGSRTYLANVLPRLAQCGDGSSYVVLWPSERKMPSDLSQRAENLSFVRVKVPQKPVSVRLLYEQLVMPMMARGADVLLAPVDVGPVLHCPCPVVLAIRNPNPFFDMPRAVATELNLWSKRLLIALSAKRAARVIFVSEHSKQRIVPQIGIPLDKAQVIYHGMDHSKFDRKKRKDSADWNDVNTGSARSYVLCVSTVTRHKNFEVLLRAYASLADQLRSDHALVIAGRVAEPDYHQELDGLSRELGVGESVRFIGEYPYENIENLYFGASAYVLPSLVETFGHTLVEAMASGVPVMASDASCTPEIVGDGGLLFDPHNPKDLAEQLASVLTEEGLRDRLVQAGQLRAKAFSWDETTRRLVNVLHSVGG